MCCRLMVCMCCHFRQTLYVLLSYACFVYIVILGRLCITVLGKFFVVD